MRVDEGRNNWNLPAIKNEGTYRSVGGESRLSDPGSELCLGREKEKGEVRIY